MIAAMLAFLQEHGQEHAQPHGGPEAPAEGFNAGKVIIEHVSNSGLDHPLIHLPKVFGIDFSVTKHVFMLWLVAALVFVIVTAVGPPVSRGRIAWSRPAS